MVTLINFYLLPGIVLGCIYALGAIGVSLVFGNLRFANFAHGALMTLGAYFTLSLATGLGLHPLLALIPAMLATGVMAAGLDRAFLRPFRASAPVILLIASLGIALMVRSTIQLGWGVELRSFTPGEIQRPLVLFDTIRVLPRHLLIIITAVVLMLALHWLITRTRIGKAMRAMSDSPELARLSGIDTERVILVTWLIAGALAAAAGTLLGMDTQLRTTMGFHALLPVFAAALLGGIGRPYGAMAGGLVIGIAQELVVYPWIGTTPLLSPSYKEGVAFAVMVAILIWRPTGLFAGRQF